LFLERDSAGHPNGGEQEDDYKLRAHESEGKRLAEVAHPRRAMGYDPAAIFVLDIENEEEQEQSDGVETSKEKILAAPGQADLIVEEHWPKDLEPIAPPKHDCNQEHEAEKSEL